MIDVKDILLNILAGFKVVIPVLIVFSLLVYVMYYWPFYAACAFTVGFLLLALYNFGKLVRGKA